MPVFLLSAYARTTGEYRCCLFGGIQEVKADAVAQDYHGVGAHGEGAVEDTKGFAFFKASPSLRHFVRLSSAAVEGQGDFLDALVTGHRGSGLGARELLHGDAEVLHPHGDGGSAVETVFLDEGLAGSEAEQRCGCN